MSFDLAVGVNQQQMNDCSQQLYNSVPSLFTGSGTSPQYPGITMKWQATQAPGFDLSQPAPVFNLHYPNLYVALMQTDNEQTTFNLDVTVSCEITMSDNKVQFAATGASCEPLQDKTENFFAQTLVLPQILSSAKKAMAGLTIPPPDMPGIPLSPVVASIQNGSIVALANLQSKGTPTFPGIYPWPPGEFFTLLSNDALQAAISHAVGNIDVSGKDKVGTSLGGAKFSFDIDIYSPGARISGDSIIMDFSVSGNVHAEVDILLIPVSVRYDVEGSPSPEATASLEATGSNAVNVVVKGLNAFTFLLKPEGNIAEKILSAITWPITEAVVSIVTPIAASTIHNVNFTSYTLPAYSINVSGTQLKFIPEIGDVANYNGYMGVYGNLKVV
jgi:hypothetical protein